MADFLSDYYLWIKAAHIIAVVAWMAGMLYLPRLFIYHVQAGQNSQIAETFKVMEGRLLRIIINPAMIATFVLGGLMLWANPGLFHDGWLHAKLTLVLLMGAVHGMLSKYRRQLAQGTCTKSVKYFRILNEIPTALMVAIIILVVVKPF